MRFLCLHGSGTTGDILSVQLASLKHKLGNKHTFDYWTGSVPSKAGPGVGPFFEPPYYSWWATPSEADVRSAAESLLIKLNAQREPYDVLIGFSQGVALIASTILLCKNERPDMPLPFKGAMLFSGPMPVTFLENYMPVSQKAKDITEQVGNELSESSAKNAKKVKCILENGQRLNLWDYPTMLWDGEEQITRDPWTLPPLDETDVFGLDLSNLPKGAMLDIPTVVVYGHKDPVCPSHVQLAMLCDPDKRLVYDHRGGHEIPRKPNVTKDLTTAVNWLVDQIESGN